MTLPRQTPGPDPEPLTWDELDQLADWTAGLLTGPDAVHIAHLVTTDPRWTHAHTTITTNQPTITTALHTAAPTPDQPIPTDIATRITTALTNTPLTNTAVTNTAVTTTPTTTRAHTRNRRTRNRTSTRRATTRPQLLSLAAAIVLVLCGFGGYQFVLNTRAAQDTGGYDVEAALPASAPEPAPGDSLARSLVTVATGTDYRSDSLRRSAPPSTNAQLSPPGPLASLAQPDRLLQCFGAIAGEHQGAPEVVDFARFEAEPAAIVWWRTDQGVLAIAVGPDCGVGGAHILVAVQLD